MSSIAQRFKDFRTIVGQSASGQHTGDVIQAAATLVLAEVIQGTTHSVDLTFDNGSGELGINATVGGNSRNPIEIEQR
jgi:hypothetical protein